MSPLSPEHWSLSLSPQGLAALRRGRAGTRVHEHVWLPCPAQEPGEAAWGPALRALRQWAAALAGDGRRRVTVVLSNHFLRYTLVPWNDAVISADEEAAHARHCFASIYGSIAEDWVLRIASGGWRQTAVASAVDAGLLQGLEEILDSGGIRLDSVQPYLMAAFNHWRRHLDGAAVWFVLAEPGKLCLTRLAARCWTALDSQRADAGWGERLEQILEREYLIHGLPEEEAQVYLCAPGVEVAAPSGMRPWRLHHLSAPTPRGIAAEAAAPYHLALCG